MARQQARQDRDWYKVSVDTLRGWGVFFAVLVIVGLAYVGYRWWETYTLRREASIAIDQARVLIQQLQSEKELGTFRSEYTSAWESFQQAQEEFARQAYTEALQSGRRSRALLLSILDALRNRGAVGEAQFISVQGKVEFRRGEGGLWEEARSRVALRSGDYVKTGTNGSAEIMFLDGTLYTVRPNTLFIVSRTRDATGVPGEQAIKMEYGWVNLSTSKRGSMVTTPTAEARVREQSEALVAYEKDSEQGRFVAYRGGMEITSRGGLTRRVGELEQVVQRGDLLSEPRPIPGPPELVSPADNFEVSFDRVKTLALNWEAADGAVRYALQVSRSHLFVDNIIDVEDRIRTSATLGLRGQGVFQWRVAGINRGDVQGPWSPSRRFRVAAFQSGEGDGDSMPPRLELEDITSYGNIFIFGGRTEPGTVVEINGEAVTVGADGTFVKTIQVTKEGWSFVEIRARDAAGNETLRRHRVFVESL